MFAADPDRQATPTLGLLKHDDVVVLTGVGDAADVADPHIEEALVDGGWHDVLLGVTRARTTRSTPRCYRFQAAGRVRPAPR
jgi:hypothetical protein